MGSLKVMSPQHGDIVVHWDPNDPESVQAAKAQFDALVGGDDSPQDDLLSELHDQLAEAHQIGDDEEHARLLKAIRKAKKNRKTNPRKRFAAFKLSLPTKGEQIDEFDPEAGSIVLVPPMAGG